MSSNELSFFERIGGLPTVESIVERFYDLIEHDPAYAELRGLHGPDLTPTRKGFVRFLAGWMGGPRDWFENSPVPCVMTLHRPMTISREVAGQWTNAMVRAITAETGIEPAQATELSEALARVAFNMITPETRAQAG